MGRSNCRRASLWRLPADPQRGDLFLQADFDAPDSDEISGMQWQMVDARVRKYGSTGGEYSCDVATTYAQQESAKKGTLTILELTCDERLAITVLSLSEARRWNGTRLEGVDIIWPREDRPADQWIEGDRRVPIHVAATSEWEVGRPVRERYLVIATKRPSNFYPLIKDEPTKVRGDAIPAVLREAVEAAKMVSRGSISIRGDNWGVLALDLLVSGRSK
jgi:hypothetical protein